jgi:hypothetical protein
MDKIEIILSSPLRRAIQTAIYSFLPALERDEVKLVLTPLAQEISGKACDVGLEREDLKREVERLLSLDFDGEGGKGKGVGGKIDYEGCEEGWCLKVHSSFWFRAGKS